MSAVARPAPEQMSDDELVEAALEKSGLSGRQFAEDVIGCDESSLRRWRNRRSPMSKRRRLWFINFLHEGNP